MIAGLPAPARRLRIVILGLSITSSWGNGHATTYRSLMRALCRRGHEVLFLERDQAWYRANRDLPRPPFGATHLYGSLTDLREEWCASLGNADLIILGSYVPEGISVAALLRSIAHGIVAFYDIDTPVTLARLAAGDCTYLTTDLIPDFDLYLSFTGGPVLDLLEQRYGARAARPLYCGADLECHRPETPEPGRRRWEMGYLGTYSPDRQPTLERLLCEPARRWSDGRFVVAGPLYPAEVVWPAAVERLQHVGPDQHAAFYARQRFTLNVTRADMIRTGWSPSVRLFEAAACGVPIISDWWAGLDSFFVPDREILIARTADEVLSYLRELPEEARRTVAGRARDHVLACHTALHRAATLETYVEELLEKRRSPPALVQRAF